MWIPFVPIVLGSVCMWSARNGTFRGMDRIAAGFLLFAFAFAALTAQSLSVPVRDVPLWITLVVVNVGATVACATFSVLAWRQHRRERVEHSDAPQ